MADRTAIECCRAFFGLSDADEHAVSGNVGTETLLHLWQEQGFAFYENPLALLRQEVWHATMRPQACPPPEGFWRLLSDDAQLLDYGCGTAELERERWIDLGRQTTLVDVSDCVRRYLQHKYREAIANGTVYVQEPGNPPFDESSFDALVCTDVFEHVVNPLLLLQVLWRTLKPQGMALFVFGTSYPHAGHLQASIQEQPAWFQWLQKHSTIIGEDGYVWVMKP